MKMRILSIGDIADVLPGYAFKSSQYSSDGIKLLRGVNVSPESIDWSDCAFWRKADGDGLDNYILQNEDIVIGMDRPWISSGFRIARVGDNDLPSLLVQRVARLRTRQGHNQRYLYYILCASAFQSHLKNLHTETTVPHISHKDIESFKVEMPALSEQRRIADILDKADAIRRKRKQAIALTDQLLRSTFLEMFGDPVTNPKGWPEIQLSKIADVSSGVAKGKNYEGVATVSVPYMRVANVQDGYLDMKEIKTIEVAEEEARRYQLSAGDILLTEGGDPDKLGRGAVWNGEINPCIHQNHIFRVRSTEQCLPEFLSALLGSERGKRYFLRAAKQTTGIASINMTQLRAFPVFIPAMGAQMRYRECVSLISNIKQRLSLSFSAADDLFSSLAYRAFRSELSLPEQDTGQLSMFNK
ncbi:MAG: restriction endonuclease subunit S [Polyangia bacterium]